MNQVKYAKYLLQAIVILFCLTIFSHQSMAQKSKISSARKNVSKVFYGQASFYANKFHGRRTASGEIFSQNKFTCACNALPLGTWVKVTNLRNNRTVIVKVNDRLHPKVRRAVDLTRAAAQKLAFISSGLTRVKVEVLPKGKY